MVKLNEYRRIDFGTDLIAEAVRATIIEIIRVEMPDAELDEVRMATAADAGAADNAILYARWKRAGGLYRDCAMDAEEVVAVLIGWCRIKGIPLPRGGEKELEAAEDGVSLVIRRKGLGPAARHLH